MAGVIELSLGGRGPKRGFLFDPHRLALPCWAMAGQRCALLTFDRHFDLVPPQTRCAPGRTLAEYDELARNGLDRRNVDHILAACEAELLSSVCAVARSWPAGCFQGPHWKGHAIFTAPSLPALLEDKVALAHLEKSPVVLDFDLDTFVTPSEADPFTLVPWSEEAIADYLLPAGSASFWKMILDRCLCLTFAREPAHCGGVIEANRLFEKACRVIFERLLETDLP